jgi:hypothetical protein
MVRRGSAVRVRQRALQKRRKLALFVRRGLARSPICGTCGALYGAFRFRAQAPKRRKWTYSPARVRLSYTLQAAVLVSCELGWVATITRIVKPLSPQMRFSFGDDSHDLQPARGYGAVYGAFRFRLLRSSAVAQLVLSAGSTRSAWARELRTSIREAGCTK